MSNKPTAYFCYHKEVYFSEEGCMFMRQLSESCKNIQGGPFFSQVKFQKVILN